MRIAVVDASVAVKWVTDEGDALSAEWLLGHAEALIAPAHWLGEAANGLWAKCTVRGELTKAEVTARIAWLATVPVAITPLSELICRAAEIALDLRATIYDSLYLALALERRAPLVTADRRLFERMLAHRSFRKVGIWIGDVERYRNGQ